MKRAIPGKRIIAAGVAGFFALPVRADYADLVSFFAALGQSPDAGTFPVVGRGRNDLESAFGPRVQPSTGLNDWHRGLDVEGTLNTDSVVAPLKGYLSDYRFTSSGGNIVILEHRFADFLGGSVPSIEYGGRTLTRFYTWYYHLFDDGVAGNGVGTSDLIANFSVGQSIAAGTPIGILGNSGSAAAGGSGYAPHLHLELRVGTNSSLEFQLGNPGTTQWGFDPHMNPLLLLAPTVIGSSGYAPELREVTPFAPGQDATFRFSAGSDDHPLLNRWDIRLVRISDGLTMRSHALDSNQRIGFDASSTAALDAFAEANNVPFVRPRPYGDTATDFQADLVVPKTWWQDFDPSEHRLEVFATDIWGNVVTVAVPEPPALALCGLGLAALLVAIRRRLS